MEGGTALTGGGAPPTRGAPAIGGAGMGFLLGRFIMGCLCCIAERLIGRGGGPPKPGPPVIDPLMPISYWSGIMPEGAIGGGIAVLARPVAIGGEPKLGEIAGWGGAAGCLPIVL